MRTTPCGTLRCLLLGFAAVMLVIYFRAFVADILKSTAVFPLLFPNGGWGFDAPRHLTAFARWSSGIDIKVTTTFMDLLRGFMPEKFLRLVRELVLIPVVEELHWRAPLWLTHRFKHSAWWKAGATLSVLGFTLSHQTGIMNIMVIFTAALVFTWLVKKTGRIWPSILLHAILNIKDF